MHDIGKAAFVEETIGRDTISARKLCTAFGLIPPPFLDGAPDEAYHPILALAISREFSRRMKLPQYNTVHDAVKLLRESKNIIVLTGAGVSLFATCVDCSIFLPVDLTYGQNYRFRRVSASRTFGQRIRASIQSWSI